MHKPTGKQMLLCVFCFPSPNHNDTYLFIFLYVCVDIYVYTKILIFSFKVMHHNFTYSSSVRYRGGKECGCVFTV